MTYEFSMAISPMSRNSQDKSPRLTLISVNNSGLNRLVEAELQISPPFLVIADP